MRSSIAKVVNPLGTVTEIVESQHDSQLDADEFAEEYSRGAYIHENCDESLFRPYVAVISGSIDDGIGGGGRNEKSAIPEKPKPIGQKLIVPVIDSVQLEQMNREKLRQLEMKRRRQDEENIAKFEQMSLLNRKDNSKVGTKVDEKTQKIAIEEKKKELEMAIEEFDDSVVGICSEPMTTPEKKQTRLSPAVEELENSVLEICSEPMSKPEKKGKTEPVSVTVKLKKKPNKGQASKSIESPIECDETGRKKPKNPTVAATVAATNEPADQKGDSDVVEIFATPKLIKSKKERKASMESGSSKESSVEKDLVVLTAATASMTVSAPPTAGEPTTKSKKKKQRKSELAAAAAAAAISTSSSDDAKGGSASEQVFASKGRSESQMDRSGSMGGNPFLMEEIERIDGAQCAEIQDSLLKTCVSATVSIRKGSLQAKQQHRDDGDVAAGGSGKSGKKKKWSKESIESEATTSTNSPSCNAMDEFTYPDPSELTDADNLSFKSIIDDQITMIPMESIANVDDDVEWPQQGERRTSKMDPTVTSDYDKLSDEAEAEMAASSTQYADCKTFQLVTDESDTYMRALAADTNSSDDTEETKSTSEKVVTGHDDNDEELEADSSKHPDDTLPNQSDSMTQPLAPEAETTPAAAASEPSQTQSQSQKQTNSNTNSGGGGGNNNKKKKPSKKRR